MPSIKISELPVVSGLGALGNNQQLDILMLIQQGISKKMTLANFLSNLNYPVVVNGNKNQTTGFHVHGNGTTDVFVVNPNNNNVGVGPAPSTGEFPNPSAKLDVNGNIIVHGNYIEASEYLVPPTIPATAEGATPILADRVPANYTDASAEHEHIAQAGVISNLIAITTVSTFGDSLYHLSAGTHGQEKTIIIADESGGSLQVPPRASVDLTLVGGKTNITIKGIGSTVSLKYIFINNAINGWTVVGQYGNITVS